MNASAPNTLVRRAPEKRGRRVGAGCVFMEVIGSLVEPANLNSFTLLTFFVHLSRFLATVSGTDSSVP